MRSLERIVALLPWCSSVCPSGTGMHCDHTGHVNADLSWLDSPMFWTPWHQNMSTYSQLFAPVPPRTGVGYGCATRRDISRTVEDRGQVLSNNRKSLCRVDLHNNGWPWVTLNGCFTVRQYRLFGRGVLMSMHCDIVHTKFNIIRVARYLCGSWA